MAVEYAAIIFAPELELEPGAKPVLEAKFGGKAALNHSIDTFDNDDYCHAIYLAAEGAVHSWISGNPLAFASPKMNLVKAEASPLRTYARLAEAASSAYIILHDALRPNFGSDLLARLVAVVKPDCGAAPAWEARPPLVELQPLAAAKSSQDSVLGPRAEKRLGMAGAETAAANLFQLQMPQAYSRDSFLAACNKALSKVPEDGDPALLYRAAGLDLALVRGRLENLRIDGESELRVLQKLLGMGPTKKDKYTGLGW